MATIPGLEMSEPLAAEIWRAVATLQPDVGWEISSGGDAAFTGQRPSANLTHLRGIADEDDAEAAWRAVVAAVVFVDKEKRLDPMRVEVQTYSLQADQE